MRHLKAGRKFGMTTSHRMAMLRNMVTSLIEHEKIQTTDTRAKDLSRVAEKMVTLGKRGDLHARRLAMRVIREKSAAKKLFEEIAPRFQGVNGGYTRITKLRHRPGDNALMSVIEFSRRADESTAGEKKKKEKK